MNKQSYILGSFRHLTPRYADIKKTYTSISNKKGGFDNKSSLNENGKTTLLIKSNNSFIELKNTVLPPQYMDLFEKTTDNFQEIENKYTRLQEEQQKRVIPKFNEEENRNCDKNISSLIDDITKRIKNCDQYIKQIAVIQLNSFGENLMKDNIKIYLVAKLQEISKKVKQNEEEYMNKYKEFCGNEMKNAYSSSGRGDISSGKPGSFLELDKSDELLRQRDIEINKLVHSITDLAQIFHDLSSLVNEQDRIDFNIEASIENTKKANIHLLKTEKNLETSCARNSIMMLIVIIFIECLLLLLKFRNKFW